jgi:hypothetical protein
VEDDPGGDNGTVAFLIYSCVVSASIGTIESTLTQLEFAMLASSQPSCPALQTHRVSSLGNRARTLKSRSYVPSAAVQDLEEVLSWTEMCELQYCNAREPELMLDGSPCRVTRRPHRPLPAGSYFHG